MTVSTSWNIFGDFDHLGMIWFRLRLHKLFCWRNSRCRLLCKWYRLRPPWLTKLMHQTFFPVKSIMVVGLRISLISSFCFPGKRCHLILLHDASVFMIVIEVEWRLHVGHHFTKKSWTFNNMLVGLTTDHHLRCSRDMPYCLVKQYNISDKDTCKYTNSQGCIATIQLSEKKALIDFLNIHDCVWVLFAALYPS